MILKLTRSGRMWEGKNGPEEVMDVFHGKDFKKKLSRGFCLAAYKEILKRKIAKGESLFICLEVK